MKNGSNGEQLQAFLHKRESRELHSWKKSAGDEKCLQIFMFTVNLRRRNRVPDSSRLSSQTQSYKNVNSAQAANTKFKLSRS